MGKLFGYGRVSTKDQNLDLQINALLEAGCHRSDIHIEKVSTRKKRPVFEEVMSLMLEGDTLVIWKLDRMGRSMKDLIEIINSLNERNINLRVLSGSFPIDTSTPAGKFMFHISAAIAEYERGLISERTLAGLEAARKRGIALGRKKKLTEKDVATMVKMKEAGMSNSEIQKNFGIGKTSFHRYINEYYEKK